MNLSEQAVYFDAVLSHGMEHTAPGLRWREVRFKGVGSGVFTVRFVGNESDLLLQGARGNCGHWVIDYKAEAAA